MFDTEKLLSSVDLLDLVQRAGAQPKHVGASWRCACPIHGGHNDSGFAIYIKDGRQLWQCFSGDCGGGDAISFVMSWQNMDFKRACGFLGGDVLSDPAEMLRLANERAERAKQDLDKAIAKAEAARAELEAAQVHIYYHEHMPECAHQNWLLRGLNDSDIGFWYLGGKADFVIAGNYHTPTLTIPIFDTERRLLNVKHRLLNPMPEKPNDKYRPEREGLGPFPPFLAVPEMGYDGETILVLEGEIKAMVTWARCGGIDVQCIGVPGRSNYKTLVDKLFGKNVVVVPDPGAEKDAIEFCREVKGRTLLLHDKIDDLIVRNRFDGDWLKSLLKQGRRL